MLKKDIEDIASRLEEAGSNTATQVELNKKKEGELAPLKSEQEELNITTTPWPILVSRLTASAPTR